METRVTSATMYGQETACDKIGRHLVKFRLNNDKFQSFVCWTMLVVAVMALLPPAVLILIEIQGTGCSGTEFTIVAHYSTYAWMEQTFKKFKLEMRNKTKIDYDVCYRLVIGNDHFEKKYKPSIWQPPNYFWLDVAEEDLGDPLVSDRKRECLETAAVPFGIVTWESYATFIPDSLLNSVAMQALIEQGRVPYFDFQTGTPKVVDLHITHGHPNVTTGGWMTLVTTMVAAGGDVPEDIWILNSTENTSYSYGPRDVDLVNEMIEHGPFYYTGVSGFESTVLYANEYEGDNMRRKYGQKLSFLYFNETYWNSHPLCRLDKGKWMNSKKKELAQLFLNFTRQIPEFLLMETGVRPFSYAVPLDENVFNTQNGVNPNITRNNTYVLEEIDSASIKKLWEPDGWQSVKKPVYLTLLIDVSNRMTDEVTNSRNRWSYINRGLRVFGEVLEDRAIIKLVCFTNNIVSCGAGDQGFDGNGSLVNYRQDFIDFTRHEMKTNSNRKQNVFKALDDTYDKVEDARSANLKRGKLYSYKIVTVSQNTRAKNSVIDEHYQSLVAKIPNSTVFQADDISIFGIWYFDRTKARSAELLENLTKLTAGEFFDAKTDIKNVFQDVAYWF